jgi:hypothetical protein
MRTTSRLIHSAFLPGLITAAGLLAACGGVEVNDPPAAPAPSVPATAVGSLTMTLTRSGGIAGVQEMVIVDAAGNWTYTDQRKEQSLKGTFTPAQMVQLSQLALDPRLADEVRNRGTGVCNDGFQYSLTVGSQNYSFDDCGEARPAVQALLGVIAEATPL